MTGFDLRAGLRSIATHWRFVRRGTVIAWMEPHAIAAGTEGIRGQWVLHYSDPHPIPCYRPDRQGD